MRIYRRMARSCVWWRVLLAGCAALVLLGDPAATQAAFVTLYDGNLGGLPATQGLIYQGIGPSQSFAAGMITLDSSANKAFQGGYTPKPGQFSALDRTQGFTLSFTLQLTAEDHAGSDRNSDQIDDRAGLAIIALASDNQGIELGFWANRVWAQAAGGIGDGPLFTQAEGVALDTSIERTYALTIRANSYELRTGDVLVLRGALRDYSAFGAPYTSPSFIFLGDDTTSAAATTRIRALQLQLLDHQIALPLVVKG